LTYLANALDFAIRGPKIEFPNRLVVQLHRAVREEKWLMASQSVEERLTQLESKHEVPIPVENVNPNGGALALGQAAKDVLSDDEQTDA
jgi:hypothetical protein